MTEPTQDVLDRIAANVNALCEAKGWSLRELARRSDVGFQTVRRMALGEHEVGVVTAIRVAAALGTTVERLRKAPEKSRDLLPA